VILSADAFVLICEPTNQRQGRNKVSTVCGRAVSSTPDKLIEELLCLGDDRDVKLARGLVDAGFVGLSLYGSRDYQICASLHAKAMYDLLKMTEGLGTNDLCPIRSRFKTMVPVMNSERLAKALHEWYDVFIEVFTASALLVIDLLLTSMQELDS
jgi:hypothetical protein